jgi:hypothetical protein
MEQMMARLLAEIRTNRAEMKAGYEQTTARLKAKLDAHHERMMACLGKTEATDLEASPEEMESEVGA